MLLVGRGNGASSMLGGGSDLRFEGRGRGRRGYESGSDDRMEYK
jgi:hypothetical protein